HPEDTQGLVGSVLFIRDTIYTTLAKLDQLGYVTVLDKDEHSQKMIYHLTDEGRALEEEWIKEETPAPTHQDEFLGKLF
ncbi:hypothetical protein ACPTGR_15090, partial [Enterococcus faecium]